MLRNLKIFNLPEIEEKVLRFWKENHIFQKSLEARAGGKPFRFYEGPPYANGKPGIHHVLARVVKDVIVRFKTMEGFFVERKAGWDTHGLPVEIAAEKELGLKSKADIEKIGIAAFNKKAKELVWTHKDEWELLTERIGYWLDLEHPYITYEPKYIESLWWIFRELDKRKLFQKTHKVLPWCTRCGTALSSHELAQGYREITDISVHVKFRLVRASAQKVERALKLDPAIIHNSSFVIYPLSWTTTPWTLSGNVALAVGENIKYAIAKNEAGEFFVLADEILKRREVFKTLSKIGEISGKELVGLSYEPLFAVRGLKSPRSHKIYAADFVTTTDGTGIVHTAVMYGEDDYRLGREKGLPMMHTVDETGHFTKAVQALAGLYVRAQKTEEKILAELEESGKLFAKAPHAHEYPFCWRCGTAVIYYARESWFITMSVLRKELLAANKKINWIPAHIKEGRFGEWLREVKDWAVSRERYWGTPLPVWESKDGKKRLVIGSLAELKKYAVTNENRFFGMRHGEATHNMLGRLAGGAETEKLRSELTPKGVRQVETAIAKLKKLKIDTIVASPYYRSGQTAKIIAKALGVKKIFIDKRLGEVNAGVFNWHDVAQYRAFYYDPAKWMTQAPEKGESHADVRRRVMAAIHNIDKKFKKKTVLIVSHGDPLRLLAGSLQGLQDNELQNMAFDPANAEAFELEPPALPFDDDGRLDLHRPYIDAVVLRDPRSKKELRRVREVADVWFDSGAMPYAEWHYPFENKEKIDRGFHFPADYIAEGMDQTRGWFYVLLALGVALEKGAPYKNVISLGLINDKFGAKMSKSKGNIIEPFSVIQKYGADPLRFYFFASSGPGETKNFDEAEVAKILRRIFLILYNSFVFLATAPEEGAPIKILDEWILSRIAETKRIVSEKLNAYDITSAARAIEPLIDDLSRWYIRRTRKNVSKPVLARALFEISKLLAPFAPFFSEALYQSLSGEKESVHLEEWGEKGKINKDLVAAMAEIRRLAALALKAREEAKIKIRQPLGKLKVKSEKGKGISKELFQILRDEVNVKEVVIDPEFKNEIELDTKITPALKAEGAVRELSRMVNDLRANAELVQKDEIELSIDTDNALRSIIEPHFADLKKRVHARTISFSRTDKFDAELDTTFENSSLWIAVRKI